MSPRIMCHHHDLTESEKEFITQKVQRLKKYFDRIQEVSVILDSGKSFSLAEILTSGPHTNLRFQHQAPDMRTAFEGAIDKAERGLTKNKERKWGDKMHRRRNFTIRRFDPVGFDFAADLSEDHNGQQENRAFENLEPKPMTLEEAHLQLETRQKGLLVFVNAKTDKINILHRNAQNEVEWVELENDEVSLDEIAEMQV